MMLMKKVIFGALFIVAFTSLSIFAEDVKWKGEYKWVRTKGEKKGTVTAEFAPDGENKWKVKFFFKWGKKDHIYTGTATGSVKDGKLKGTVLNDTKKRSFTFEGTVKEGTLTGTYNETTKGRAKKTGVITMSVK